MNIYCDESGGIGRGVMTLAAVTISPEAAQQILADFRKMTGLRSELKGSRIDLEERAYFYELFVAANARATVGVAISALKPVPGEDRGEHDQEVYAALFNDVIGAMLLETGGCAEIIFDDGRYDPKTLASVQADLAAMVGTCGKVGIEVSHHLAGLQIADVVANSFFNRALVSERQGQFIAMLQPHLDSDRIKMRILPDVDV